MAAVSIIAQSSAHNAIRRKPNQSLSAGGVRKKTSIVRGYDSLPRSKSTSSWPGLTRPSIILTKN
jgi:hypothetical protein